MSFANKTDFVNIGDDTILQLKANNQNASLTLLQIPGVDGSIIDDIITGRIKNPSCDYAIIGSGSKSWNLGQVYNTHTADTDPCYALQHIHISTGAGAEPTLTADAVQIENGSDRTFCIYPTSSIALTPARHALMFGAFTYEQSASLTLQTSEYDATANIDPSTINNSPVASDATAGIETVTPTFWTNSDTTEPTVTITSGWHVTTEWNCVGSDASMFVWTVTLSKYLTATQPTP